MELEYLQRPLSLTTKHETMATKQTIFLGSFVHSKSLTELEIVENGAIGVDEKGVIRFVEKSVASLDEVKSKAGAGWENAETVTVKKGGWLFPGFIGECQNRQICS